MNKLVSPTTNETLAELDAIDSEGIHQAIEEASASFQKWKHSSREERIALFLKVAEGLRNQKESLARTMALEMGKTLRDGLAEVEYAASYFDWFAGPAGEIPTSSTTLPTGKTLTYLKEPVGVVGIITPWNFPLAMAARKIAAALAAGCPLLWKPSPECPLSALALAELCEGLVQVLIGDEKLIGKELLASDTVRKISFTGSTDVGIYLYQASAPTLKKLTLELGGHAPLLVFNDADLEQAVTESLAAKFRSSGQTCVSPNRFLVQGEILPRYRERLLEETKKLKVGSPLDAETDLTDTLHPSVPPKVQAHIQDAVEKGAKTLLKGEHPYEPTILDEVQPHMRIFHEETFGPVIPLLSFKTKEEAVQLANDTPYGLAAYLFTKKEVEIAHALDYGVIGINDGRPSNAALSFGGIKHSGFGREGGPEGIDEYLVAKTLSSN